MTVDPTDPTDPTDPDTFQDLASPDETDVEAPEADSAEQRTGVSPERDRDEPGQDTDSDDLADADEGDLAEQARVVSLDEDDYR